MENEVLQQTKHHFSKLGLMYFLGTLIIYAVQLAAIFIGNTIAPETLSTNGNIGFLVSMLPMYAIAMPIMALLIRTVPAAPIEKKKLSVGKILIAMLMTLSVMYLSNLLGTLITQIIASLKGSNVNNTLITVVDNVHPLTTIIIMVILAPIAEELIFRKLLIDRLVSYGEGTAILFSGLMFGLFHGNLNQFVYAFALGIFLGFIYVKTGNVLYPIFLHMFVNFNGSFLSVQLLKNTGLTSISTIDPTEMTEVMMQHLPQLAILCIYFLIYFACIIAGAILLIVNNKKFSCNPGCNSIPKGKRFFTTVVNVGMILYGAFWILMIILQLFQ